MIYSNYKQAEKVKEKSGETTTVLRADLEVRLGEGSSTRVGPGNARAQLVTSISATVA